VLKVIGRRCLLVSVEKTKHIKAMRTSYHSSLTPDIPEGKIVDVYYDVAEVIGILAGTNKYWKLVSLRECRRKKDS
jgi:hypothetical protein